MRATLMTALVMVGTTMAARPKVKGPDGNMLVALEDIGTSCGSDAYMGYGIVEGSLERCENHSSIAMGGQSVDKHAYEKWKCEHLRVHGEYKNGACVCKNPWKGPICNEYTGCPDGNSLHNGVCTPNACQHDGKMAISNKGMDCICQGEWDGKFCDRLACWRKTIKSQEKRFRNDNPSNSCICGSHYKGEQCDEIVQCEKNGKLDGGSCVCVEGWGGELCHIKCKTGELTCSANNMFSSALIFLCTFLFGRRQ